MADALLKLPQRAAAEVWGAVAPPNDSTQPIELDEGSMMSDVSYSGGTEQRVTSQHGRVGRARLTVLRGVIGLDEVRALRRLIRPLEAEFGSAGSDSIDGRPAFERYVHRPAHARSPLDAVSSWPAFKPIVEGRLQRWVREHDGCPDCVACHVLLRRYRERERRGVNFHFDLSGLRTAVLDLSTQPYEGGLLVRDDRMAAASERWVPLRSGDALVHSSDLMHGVNVTRGERFSMVVWFDDRTSCRGPYTRWFEDGAARGEAAASHHLGSMHRQAEGEAAVMSEAERLRIARAHYARAAEGGVPASQGWLGVFLMNGMGGEVDKAAAVELWTRAATSGDRDSCRNLGLWHAEYAGSPRLGVQWWRRAAALGDGKACLWLAEAYENGQGVPTDRAEAERWLRAAAEHYHPDATAMLVHRLLLRAGASGDWEEEAMAEAKEWLRRASEARLPGLTMYERELARREGEA